MKTVIRIILSVLLIIYIINPSWIPSWDNTFVFSILLLILAFKYEIKNTKIGLLCIIFAIIYIGFENKLSVFVWNIINGTILIGLIIWIITEKIKNEII